MDAGPDDTSPDDTSPDGGDANGEPKGGRPGPADHGHVGGMATRENAPELTEPDRNS